MAESDSFKQRLFGRVNEGRYTPLPGQQAMCNHHNLGVVTDIEMHKGGLMFKGYHAHSPDKDWQSVDPSPPSL